MRSLAEMNLALHGSWLCTFMKENAILWWRVIAAKFDTVDREYSTILTRPHGKDMWKKMCIDKNKFQDCIRWRVGCGDIISFWQDAWRGG